MVKEMLHVKKTPRDAINSDYRLKLLLDRSVEVAGSLRDLYEDRDGSRKEEIKLLTANDFMEFYGRVKNIKEFHRKHPNEITIPMSIEFDELSLSRENPTDETQNLVEFTDEEGYGKYLDLHECYEKFINLKGVEKIDYVTYLTVFDRLFEIPKERKNASYKSYLDTLIDYLEGYQLRVRPLWDIDEEWEKVREEFEKNWAEGSFPGWPKEATGALAHTGAHLDLSAFSSWEELASLGLDRLKSALVALGLKCGGTLEERAQRLFQTKGRNLDELDPSFFTKSKPGKATSKSSRDSEKQKEVAQLEARVYRLAEMLGEQRAATRDNVQRKQARTGGERDDDDDAAGGGMHEPQSDDSDADDDNDIPYNPKNLPLGWDGKPIPYWLYKLHGLNISYTCEICGNYTYRGPKVFQRHFAEWRHAHGMRCLGVPNTAHFANVTLIEDAVALWQKIKSGKEVERWRPEVEEEFEDSSGNVVSKKIYEDLRRQGLL